MGGLKKLGIFSPKPCLFWNVQIKGSLIAKYQPGTIPSDGADWLLESPNAFLRNPRLRYSNSLPDPFFLPIKISNSIESGTNESFLRYLKLWKSFS